MQGETKGPPILDAHISQARPPTPNSGSSVCPPAATSCRHRSQAESFPFFSVPHQQPVLTPLNSFSQEVSSLLVRAYGLSLGDMPEIPVTPSAHILAVPEPQTHPA